MTLPRCSCYWCMEEIMTAPTFTEKKLMHSITEPRWRSSLDQIRQAVQDIWSPEVRIIQDYTDHGIPHSERLVQRAANLLKANNGHALSPSEMYLLLAGIYLHDIGMQCDVNKYPEVRDRAVNIGAKFQGEFKSEAASRYTPDEQQSIRENHHFLSAAWIGHAWHKSDPMLGIAIRTVPNELVEDLIEICKYHAKLPIADCPERTPRNLQVRRRLVAALLRFSDELDVDGPRVKIATVEGFRIPAANAVFWWLHYQTAALIDGAAVTLTTRLSPDDFNQFREIVKAIYIDKFVDKNRPVLALLHDNDIPIVIDANSDVISYEFADPLPGYITQYLSSLQPPKDKGREPPLSPQPPRLAPPINFAGRDLQLQQLDRWYESDTPLAAIVGTHGVGKSFLVRQWCARKTEENSITVWYVDVARQSFLGDAEPEDYAEGALHDIADEIGLNIDDEDESLPRELANKVRQSAGILVLDHLEAALDQRRRAGTPIGKPADRLKQFFQVFVRMRAGLGRVILVSCVRPAGIVEEEPMRHGLVTSIAGGTTRDPLQLGGFLPEEAMSFASARLGAGGETLIDDDLHKAIDRLGGHPEGLNLFLGLSSADRRSFVAASRSDQPLETNFKSLLDLSVKACSSEEVAVLYFVSLLNRPEREIFISNVGQLLGVKDAVEDLESLRRRSLIEYGFSTRAGYSAHRIVIDYARQLRPPHVPSSVAVHLATAREYERAITVGDAPGLPEQKELAVEAAYHFSQAHDQTKAIQWRNEYTRLALSIGKRAHLDGNYQMARENASAFIKATEEGLIKTPATPRYLSGAHVYRAVNQHQIKFDWAAERFDLHEALRLNPANVDAITFSLSFIYGAVRARQPWAALENELEFFVEAARRAAQSPSAAENIRQTLLNTLIKLLCLWGDRTPNETRRRQIIEELSKQADLIMPQVSAGVGTEAEDTCMTYLELLDFCRRHAATEDEASRYTASLYSLAAYANRRYRSSSQLWMKRVEAAVARSQFALQEQARLAYLAEAKTVLLEMSEIVSPPSGYVRHLVDVTLRLTRGEDSSRGLAEIDSIRQHLTAIGAKLAETAITQDEWDAAQIRLAIRIARLEPEHAEEHLRPAIHLIQQNLQQPAKWLTMEMAEQAIEVLSGAGTEDWQSDESHPEHGENFSLADEIPISRDALRLLDQKIKRAEETYPDSKFNLLRLSLRVQYLRRAWMRNDRQGPRRILEEAGQLAESLPAAIKDTPETLVTTSELYRLIVTRTFDETQFNSARARGIQILEQLVGKRSYLVRGLYRKAVFLRSMLDYRGARQALREYLDKEQRPYRRFFAARLFVDCVAHSIYREAIRSPQLDPHLMQDSQLADVLYKQYLTYLGIEREDIEDLRCAIRELQWIRCAWYAGLYDPGDLQWATEIYLRLSIDQAAGFRRAKEPVIIGELTSMPDRIPQLLGTNWSNPTMWREVGTLLSTLLQDSRRAQYAIHVWKLGKTFSEWGKDLPEENARRRRRSTQEDSAANLTNLNLIRAFLEFPRDSELWLEGSRLLTEFAKQQRLSWVYWRFVLELRKKAGLD